MKTERKVYIDYLRVISCLAVVIIHVFTTAKTDFPNHTQLEQVISNVVINILHFAVPIFFMITGYLFLSKNKKYSLKEYFKKYVLKYLITIFTFGFGYAIIEEIFNKNYSITMPLVALLKTLQGKSWAHMWYLYYLVGIMLLIPILKVILDKDKKYLKYILIILMVSSFVIPLIERISNINIGFDLVIKSPYLTYVIIGYYLGNSNKNNLKISIIGIIVCAVIICVSEIISTMHIDNNTLKKLSLVGNYDSFIIMLLSINIFTLFKNISVENRIVNSISFESYGIYLVHMVWINLIYKFLRFDIFGDLFILKSLFVFICTFILSFYSTKIIKKIPLLNNLL